MTGPGRRGRALFVDSSGFFAAAAARDSNFATARQILERAAAERTWLTTTTYIVAEAHALFLSRAGRDAGVRFLRGVDASTIHVVRPTAQDEAAARTIIYTHRDEEYSLTDAISVVVMDRLNITTVFTFDRHFERYGFVSASP